MIEMYSPALQSFQKLVINNIVKLYADQNNSITEENYYGAKQIPLRITMHIMKKTKIIKLYQKYDLHVHSDLFSM